MLEGHENSEWFLLLCILHAAEKVERLAADVFPD
jgi:hypothetical protein